MYRNEKLLRLVSQLPCQRCGREGWTQASHSNQLRDGKGRALKAHDYRVAALCSTCHHDIDAGNDLSKGERREAWDEAHRKTVGLLFDLGWIGVTA